MLKPVHESLEAGILPDAIEYMENYLAVHPHQINSDRLFAIKTDYQVMADYWLKGYKDPQLSRLYKNLLHRMYELYANVSISNFVLHSPFLASQFMRAHISPRDWSVQIIREQLESFVSDIAIADLEPLHTSQKRKKTLYQQHLQLIDDIFAHILTSNIWTDGQGESMTELLLAPTIDSIDQQIIISAIMLAAMNTFDPFKFRTLMHVYLRSSDEYVRQRALVGWVLSIEAVVMNKVYPDLVELINQALDDVNCRKELAELQKQIFYCMSAEEDRDIIQKEIMPDLIKNQNNIMRDGVLEQDEETMLRDILHPDEEEKNLEKVENSFRRMMDMQKQGSDIYFGGFSQMKRFAFFNEICNWFTPYYIDHPGVAQAREKFGEIKFLKGILDYGPFCNSDKYSFILAFGTVLNQIPDNVREMLNRGEAEMVQKITKEEIETPAYIRRIYLQDLYRFFRLFFQRHEFRNFFDEEDPACLFFDNSIFTSSALQDQFYDVITFLIKRNQEDSAVDLLYDMKEKYDTHDFHMLYGYLNVRAEEHYKRALELEPKSERALWGLAKLYFKFKRYDEALDIYNQLIELKPDKKTYQLSKSVCLTNLHHYDEAEQILFRLNYENPDDLNVARVLAWALTGDGKFEQAERLYDQLMAEENPADGDLFNYGFYLWFTGRVGDAVSCFRTYVRNTKSQIDSLRAISEQIGDEKYLFDKYGIIEEEINMMLDVIDV